MKITEIIKSQFSVSFEFFPPKTEEGEKDLFLNLKSLESIKPTFVSVTYGAGGSTRERTHRIVSKIAEEEKLNVMAHLTCIAHSQEDLIKIVQSYKEKEIHNLLALRGDPPVDSQIDPNAGELKHAIDLVRLIKSNYQNFFSIGGAVFFEKHPESPSWESEMKYLVKKVEAGMEFGISQIFFENEFYFKFLERCGQNQICIPIIPGIMPITNFKQIRKFATLCGATIPKSLIQKLEKYEDQNDEVSKIGVEFAIQQCEELVRAGVKGLHFYTLNKSRATMKVYEVIQKEIKSKA